MIMTGYFVMDLLVFLLVMMFQTLNQLIEQHSDCAENDNRGDDHIKLKHLRTLDDQIAETASCGEKLTDDHTHEG